MKQVNYHLEVTSDGTSPVYCFSSLYVDSIGGPGIIKIKDTKRFSSILFSAIQSTEFNLPFEKGNVGVMTVMLNSGAELTFYVPKRLWLNLDTEWQRRVSGYYEESKCNRNVLEIFDTFIK